jgi:hypothetical protein
LKKYDTSSAEFDFAGSAKFNVPPNKTFDFTENDDGIIAQINAEKMQIPK